MVPASKTESRMVTSATSPKVMKTTRRSAPSTLSISPPEVDSNQGAEHGPIALHRHRDQNHDLAAVIEAHQTHRCAVERGRDFGEILAIVEPILRLPRIIVGKGPGQETVPELLEGIAASTARGGSSLWMMSPRL